MSGIQLLLSDAHGVYIPRDFYQGFDIGQWNVSHIDGLADLDNPENEFYWETWNTVLDIARLDDDGFTWRLQQDGDLWAVCYDLMTDEEKIYFEMD